MRKATSLLFFVTFSLILTASAQELEFVFSPEGTDPSTPFAAGLHNGARGVSGPFDLDNDGRLEILVAQHAVGGRIHVIENSGIDSWEHVYSTPVLDETSDSDNARYATGADLDGDGLGEIVFVAGYGYSGTDPVLTVGAYVFEYDGQGTDNYGTYPATIGNFFEIDPALGSNPSSGGHAQKLTAADVDGDGQQELLVPINANSAHDVFYVLSVSGSFETGQAASGFVAWNIESRQNPRDDNNVWGSGSPIDMIAADMNGDGLMDISYHSWNSFNFFNGTALSPNTISLPSASTPNPHLNGTIADDVSLFGGVAADIDGDGNDEVFYPNWQTKNLAVIDYDQGQDVLSITTNELASELVPIGGAGGAAVGDIDSDGNPEVIVGASGYSATAFNEGSPSQFINVAEFMGGDPKEAANWVVQEFDTSNPIDTTGFFIIHRDSAGVQTTYFATGVSKQGTIGLADDPVFPSGIAYLGDADGDGGVEVAISFQGVDDSLQVIDEVWNAGTQTFVQTVREVIPAPARPFVRIYGFPADFNVAVERNRGSLPTGYELHANYPNPFNPSTRFSFTLPEEATVTVRIYDVTGRVVKTVLDGVRFARGAHDVSWNGTSDSGQSVVTGTYFYSLESNRVRIVRPMLLVK